MYAHIAIALEAKWTLVFVLGEFLKAETMQGVSALQKDRRLYRIELVLLANRTTLLEHVRNALMLIEATLGYAYSADFAVVKVIPFSNSTHPALFAVKNSLLPRGNE